MNFATFSHFITFCQKRPSYCGFWPRLFTKTDIKHRLFSPVLTVFPELAPKLGPKWHFCSEMESAGKVVISVFFMNSWKRAENGSVYASRSVQNPLLNQVLTTFCHFWPLLWSTFWGVSKHELFPFYPLRTFGIRGDYATLYPDNSEMSENGCFHGFSWISVKKS